MSPTYDLGKPPSFLVSRWIWRRHSRPVRGNGRNIGADLYNCINPRTGLATIAVPAADVPAGQGAIFPTHMPQRRHQLRSCPLLKRSRRLPVAPS